VNKARFKTIDEYIRSCPAEVHEQLRAFRETVRKAAPRASEKISYGILGFYLDGNLVWFAAFKRHIGFYPGPGAIETFAEELTPYRTSKGAIQFPLDRPLPLALIRKIVTFRVKQNRAEPGKRYA
jgi:uncharacterized protein YdhG (YjbR/CyaY superfamily)